MVSIIIFKFPNGYNTIQAAKNASQLIRQMKTQPASIEKCKFAAGSRGRV